MRNDTKEQILKELEKRPASVKKLLKITGGKPNTLWYNLRMLVKVEQIRPFIKMTEYPINSLKSRAPLREKEISVSQAGDKKKTLRMARLQEEEIYFEKIEKYENPTHVFRLIDSMRAGDAGAFKDFIKLCEERNIVDAEKIAYDLMCDITNRLRERVAFEFTYNKDWKDVGDWNPKTKQWEGGMRDYEYFTSNSELIRFGSHKPRIIRDGKGNISKIISNGIVVDKEKGEIYQEKDLDK